MNPADVVEKLRAAKALLRRDGWQQKRFGPRNVHESAPRCLMGTIHAVESMSDGIEHEKDALIDALDPELGRQGWLSLIQFNDAPGRTETEVHDLLDRTIQRLETE